MNWWALARSLAGAYSPLLANVFVDGSGGFDSGKRPALQPPDWVFAPVWTTLFGSIGVANFLYNREGAADQKWKGNALNGAHLALDALFIYVGFARQSKRGALWTILALWLAIAATINHYRTQSERAAWLLVPYLCWVTFATYLSYESVRINE